jgi:hypothetical protein
MGHFSRECKFVETSLTPPWITKLEYNTFLEKRLRDLSQSQKDNCDKFYFISS